MNKARRILVAGVGAMTPVLMLSMAHAGIERAPKGGGQDSICHTPRDQDDLKSFLLCLSPAEKLRIAGDRIRLSENALKPSPKHVQQPCSDRQSGCTGPAPV